MFHNPLWKKVCVCEELFDFPSAVLDWYIIKVGPGIGSLSMANYFSLYIDCCLLLYNMFICPVTAQQTNQPHTDTETTKASV